MATEEELEEWDLMVDESQSREYFEAQKRLHRQRCDEELDQAQRACDVLISAQGDVGCGKLKCQDSCPDEVHRLFCLPDTSVKIQAVTFESPPIVKTHSPHKFKTGQNVIITGLRVRAGAPLSVQNLVESLSRDHAVVCVDDCRFSLSSTGKLPCDEVDASDFLDLESAEVALNVSWWGLGRTSISLSLLLAISETASASGLGHVASKFYNGLCVSCDSLRNVADTTASHVGHTQRIMPPGRFADSLSLAHQCLRSVSDLKAPDVSLTLTHLWGRMVEALQPETWKSAVAADLCAECLQVFGSSGKHHCRNCGRVVCDACSKDRECVPWEGHFQPVRVCTPCKDVVDLKNLTLQQYDALTKQIHLVQAGLYQPKRKGIGKGKPPPFPASKGKGKGKNQEPGRGLGALAEDVKPEISEMKADFVLVERPLDFKATRLQPSGVQSRPSKEVLILTVSMNGCKHHVSEIEHALKYVTLQGAKNLESWFGKVDQIMPLEKKFSSQTLERLKAVPEEDFKSLTEHERRLRQLLLPVDFLHLRWRALRLLHELSEPNDQELYWKPLRATTGAIHAMLLGPCSGASSATAPPPTQRGSPRGLCPEVKKVIAVLYELMEPRCESLEELAKRTEVGCGRRLYVKAWEAGAQRPDVCNVKALAELLPVLEDERLGLQVALEDFQAKRRELLLIRQQGADQSLAVLSSALERVGGVLNPVEAGLSECLQLGASFLSAFGGVCDPVSASSASASSVARNVDLHLRSLRTLVQGLKMAEPPPVTVTRSSRRRTKDTETSETPETAMKSGKVLRRRRSTKSTAASEKVQDCTISIDLDATLKDRPLKARSVSGDESEATLDPEEVRSDLADCI